MSNKTPGKAPHGGPGEVRRLVAAAEAVSAESPEPSAGAGTKSRERRRRRPRPRFRLGPDGVEKRFERRNEETGAWRTEWRGVCSPLRVLAQTRDPRGEGWGKLLEIIDQDGNTKRWVMPNAMLANDGVPLREKLLGLGLVIASRPGVHADLKEYLVGAQPQGRVRTVDRVGWHNIGDSTVFVLPDMAFGDVADETVMLSPNSVPNDQGYRVAGSLDSWQAEIGRFALGNSRLIFALSAAVAAVLLYLLNAESGGVHFVGLSSIGKTLLLYLAGSVWGAGGMHGYVKRWRGTDNGIEAVAAAHCDALLPLDEIGEVTPEAAAAVAYMLANGGAKLRAGRSGEGRPAAEWRLLFLSTGEIDLATKIAESGKGRRARPGQQVRMIDIPADAGVGLGVFEELHGFPDAAALWTHLKAASTRNYGHAARALLTRIVADLPAVTKDLARYQREFIAEYCPTNADGQVHRVAARLALVAATGELATALDIFPWEPGEATRGVARCFRAWLRKRGGIGSLETIEAVAQVRHFIEQHGSSRFERFDVVGEPPAALHGERTVQRVGFRKTDEEGETTFYVLPESWRSEICAGLDAGFVARTLADRGMLRKGSDGKLTRSERLPGAKRTARCYVILSSIFSGGDGGG